jgi:predicted AlkP superfamily phosphohydrolase/phosphomutase
MSSKKIIVIGLDGASWRLLDPYIERGAMPHLKQLRDQGSHGLLHSVDPPITPAAWTSMI